ncbi:transglycosylase domain-containing protein [Kribbella sp. NPDC023972]|uniref:transglycosylase domain-containing protein n=1 Tax=Kribbella sp. NPDC023972 TaxID=3154795 RepID=UPI0033E45CF0
MSEARRKAVPVRRKRHWALRVLGWLLALFCLGIICSVAAFFIVYQTTKIPDTNKEFATNTTTVYFSDRSHEIGQFYEQNRRSVPLAQIPKHVQDSVIAAEDRTFWTNPGISPSGMARAAFNIARGEQLQSGSTLTQQYVKIMYLTQERTASRKFKELFIATKLSRSEDKKKILEGYLNTIYFGEGAYGVAAAGQAYFNVRDPKDLKIDQAALLATVLNNPTVFDPDDKSAATQKRILGRYRYVLDGMRQMGTITDAQYAAYSKQLPKLNKPQKSSRYKGSKGFLLDMVRKELVKSGFTDDEIVGGGLKVYTTIDLKAQVAANDAVFSKKQPGNASELHIGLASVRPQTGELVAVIGGPDYLKSQINWATAKARPGSSFKPFAVAAALKDGKTLEDTFEGDGPIEIRGGKYDNEFGEDYGRVSLLSATEQSINTAFYDLVDRQMENGPEKVSDVAEAAGIPKIPAADRDAPALVLGPNAYASPVDMAGAYSVFANQGQRTPVHMIAEVRDSKNVVKFSAKSKYKPVQALTPEIANTTSYALQQVVEDRKGTGRKAQEIDRPAAGKTGTAGGMSIDHRRANAKCKCEKYKEGDDTLTSWWVGYTPQLSTAVLYRAGKEGESDLDAYTDENAFFGGDYPAQTWVDYMSEAMKGQPVEEFPEPSDDNMGTPTPTYTPPPSSNTPPPSSNTPPPSSNTPPPSTKTPPPSNKPSNTPTKTKPTKSNTPVWPPIPTGGPSTEPTDTPQTPGEGQ